MKAAEARRLQVGDQVVAYFGGRGVRKVCEIVAIRWPTFDLKTTDHKGEPMFRERHYKSIHATDDRADFAAKHIEERELPDWLFFPKRTKGKP